MKVFFKKRQSFFAKRFLTILCTVLCVVLVAAQWCILSSKDSVPVSSAELLTAKISDTVTLTSSEKLESGEAYVYLNGDEYAPFEGTECEVNLYANGVVEILSCRRAEFDISYAASEVNLSVVSSAEKIRCKKGINFICRAISR